MLYLVGGELITTTVNLPGFRIELRKCNYTAERWGGWGAILGNLYSIAKLLFLFKSISFVPPPLLSVWFLRLNETPPVFSLFLLCRGIYYIYRLNGKIIK